MNKQKIIDTAWEIIDDGAKMAENPYKVRLEREKSQNFIKEILWELGETVCFLLFIPLITLGAVILALMVKFNLYKANGHRSI